MKSLLVILCLLLATSAFASSYKVKFHDMISDSSVIAFEETLEELPLESGDDLQVWIDSPGGLVTASIDLYDFLMDFKYRKDISLRTIGTGICASGATIVLQAGDTRAVTAYTLFLVHKAYNGNKKWWQIWPDPTLTYINNTLVSLFVAHTGKSREFIDKDMSYDHWMTASEAQEHGYCDFIIK